MRTLTGWLGTVGLTWAETTQNGLILAVYMLKFRQQQIEDYFQTHSTIRTARSEFWWRNYCIINYYYTIKLCWIEFTWTFFQISTLTFQDFSDIYEPLFGKESITIYNFLGRPKSRGWVKLRSTSFDDEPRVNFKFLEHPDDLELFVKGF